MSFSPIAPIDDSFSEQQRNPHETSQIHNSMTGKLMDEAAVSGLAESEII